MIKFADFTILLLYCGMIFYLSSQPSLHTPLLFPQQDKLFHMGAYSIMAFCAWRSFRHLPVESKSTLYLSILFSSLYGVSDEWHQAYVPGRSSEIADWVADSLGAILSALFIFIWKLSKEQKSLKHQ